MALTAAPSIETEARKFLARKGERVAAVWRVDKVGPDWWWLAFQTKDGDAKTAVVAGKTFPDWSLAATLRGWPSPP